MTQRVLTVVMLVVFATAAPLRAWCEAGCLVPVQQDQAHESHCAPAEPASDDAALSGKSVEDCPSLETARPAATKSDSSGGLAPAHPRTIAPRSRPTLAPRHLGTQTLRQLAAIPLRI